MDTARFQSSVMWDSWKKRSEIWPEVSKLGIRFHFLFSAPRLGGTGAGCAGHTGDFFSPACVSKAPRAELRHHGLVLKSFRCLF